MITTPHSKPCPQNFRKTNTLAYFAITTIPKIKNVSESEIPYLNFPFVDDNEEEKKSFTTWTPKTFLKVLLEVEPKLKLNHWTLKNPLLLFSSVFFVRLTSYPCLSVSLSCLDLFASLIIASFFSVVGGRRYDVRRLYFRHVDVE